MQKLLHRLLILLIFISISASVYLFYTPKNQIAPQTPPTPIYDKKIDEIKPAILENNKQPKNKSLNPPASSSPKQDTITDKTNVQSIAPEEEKILVKIKINDTDYEINTKPNSTSYTAMDTLRKSGQITFSSKEFSGLGQFIEEINGIKNSPSTGFYWTFYINNEEAKVGVSNYIIKPNDLITWRYENK